jgi:hypothetical protein
MRESLGYLVSEDLGMYALVYLGKRVRISIVVPGAYGVTVGTHRHFANERPPHERPFVM